MKTNKFKDKISIIVPIYNSEKFIEKCVHNITNQTYSNIEIILVNDGSGDNSLKLCQKLAEKDSRIKVINSKNYGVSHARNLGIKKSSGKYITFVDSDDFISKYYCEVLYQGIYENYDMAVGGYKVLVDNMNIKDSVSFEYQSLNQQEAYYDLMQNSNFLGFIWNKLYKKEIIDKLGNQPFDESIHHCEDTLFNAVYLKYCTKINYNQSVIYYYYKNMESVSNKMLFTKRHYSNIEAMKKIVEIYTKYSKENLVYIYLFYLYNISYLEVCIHNSQENIKLKNSETKSMLLSILKSNKIKLNRKIIVLFRYFCPILAFSLKEKIFKVRRNHESKY